MLLVRIDNRRKWNTRPLATDTLGKKVRVAGEDDPPELRNPVEQVGIEKPPGTVLLRREHIDAPPPWCPRNSRGHVNVHVERKAHACDFNCLSRR